jgi:hypothetical protein
MPSLFGKMPEPKTPANAADDPIKAPCVAAAAVLRREFPAA